MWVVVAAVGDSHIGCFGVCEGCCLLLVVCVNRCVVLGLKFDVCGL